MGPYILPGDKIDEYKDRNSIRTTMLSDKARGKIYTVDPITKTSRVPGQSINYGFTR